MRPIDELDDDELTALLRRAAALPDAPPALVASAIALFPATAPRPVLNELLRRLSAVLAFDSWTTSPLAMGMRAAPSDTRHLLFSVEGRDVDLRITPDPASGVGPYTMSGQILGSDEGGTVDVSSPLDGTASRTIALDDFGEFRLEDLAAGAYRITLRFAHDTVELPSIEVGPQAA